MVSVHPDTAILARGVVSYPVRMRSLSRLSAAFALTLIFLGAAAAADLSGIWRGIYTSADGRTHRITFTLKVEGGNVTGTAAGTVNKTAILDGRAGGDEISFAAQWPYGRFLYKGKLVGEELRITVQAGEHASQMTALRAPE